MWGTFGGKYEGAEAEESEDKPGEHFLCEPCAEERRSHLQGAILFK